VGNKVNQGERQLNRLTNLALWGNGSQSFADSLNNAQQTQAQANRAWVQKNLPTVSSVLNWLENNTFNISMVAGVPEAGPVADTEALTTPLENVTPSTAEPPAPPANTPGAATLEPYGGPGGGHHVPAQSAFTGDPAYDPNTALAIPNSELAAQGVNHFAVTGAQQILYRAYAQSGQTLTWDTVQSIETRALVKGGMDQATAAATISKAINTLKAAGVKGPTQIPWGNK
jgi:hypothetical protein